MQSRRIRSHDRVAFVDAAGKLYGVDAWSLRSPKGDPLTRWFEPESGTVFVGFASLSDLESDQILLVTRGGRAGLLPPSGTPAARRVGKKAMAVGGSDALLQPLCMTPKHAHLAVLTSMGRMAVLARDEVPVRASGSGVRLLKLAEAKGDGLLPGNGAETLVGAAALRPGQALRLKTKGRFKRMEAADLQALGMQARAGAQGAARRLEVGHRPGGRGKGRLGH